MSPALSVPPSPFHRVPLSPMLPISWSSRLSSSPQARVSAIEQGGNPLWDSELRGFWVDAFHDGIKTPAQVTQLIADAHAANANALFVQVRRRGDAYYSESVEPRVDDGALDPAPYDPLATLITAAHNASPPLQVYAWVVAFPVWYAGYSTTDPARHVYYRHGSGRAWDDPENWLAYQYTGGNLAPTYNLDPGHPDAAQYTVDVCLYLARHYDIDALVLDYIRYMGQDYGYNKVSEDRFHVAYSGSGHPSATDPNWMDWRREQVTNVVRRVYLETLAVKPDLILGAAAIAWGNGPDQSGGWENSSAYRSVFQDWRGWLEEGIIDVAVPMNYDRDHQPPQDQYFRNWVEWEKDHQYNRAVVPSPAAYLNYISGSLVQAAVVQAPSGLGHYALGTVFYSYAVTNIDGQPNSVFYAALSQPSGYGTPPWPDPVSAPTLPWKANPTVGHLAGWAMGPAGPLDRVQVQVTGPVNKTLLTDANGFFGAVDLPPGDYTVVLPSPATSPLYATVTAGQVALATIAPPAPEPALRAVLVDAAHDGFKTPDQVDVLLADARAAHLNAVVVQVRSYGQLYYNSPLEPPTDDPEVPAGFDPLAYLVQQAQAGDQPLDVYAWLPLLPIWNQDTPPSAPGHVYNQHPEWLTQDVYGNLRSFGEYFLDPGHPGVLTYTVGLALDLLDRYAVDGLLLDGLYYSYENSTVGNPIWGYNATSVQRYHDRYGGSGNPAPNDALWMQWRRDQTTALARQLYLLAAEAHPRVRVATVNVDWGDSPDYTGGWENSSAYGRVLQDWRAWLEEGVVDLAAPMNYDREWQADQRVWYDHWLAWEQANHGRRGIWVLQGSYLNYPEGTLAQADRIPSADVGFSSYILTNLYADPDANTRSPQPPRQPWYYTPQAEWWLWRSLALPYGYSDPANGLFTVTAPIYPSVVPTPTLVWKDVPTRGHAVGLALGPARLDSVTVTLSGPESRVLYSDGSGFFGAVDLPPGDYTAEVAGADPAHRYLVGTVTAGHVTWLQPCPCVPVETAAVNGPDRVPLGALGLYTATYTPLGATPPFTLTWDNGTVGANAVYSWTTVGFYPLVVTVTNPCSTVTATKVVEAYCQPVEEVLVDGPAQLPIGQPGVFTASVLPPTVPVTLTWDNGTVGPAAVYSWAADGLYTIVVTATSGCNVRTGAIDVWVFCQPVESVTVEGPASLPIGREGLYTATITPPTATLPLTVMWNNGTLGTSAVYSWTAAGTYSVTVGAFNRCGGMSDTLSVEVYCAPLEAVTVAGPQALLVGQEGTYSAGVVPITASLPITFTWDSGALGPTATYSWPTPGRYTVTVTATNVCNQTVGFLGVQVFAEWPYGVYLPLVRR